jgi:hypothetical protein
LSERICANAGRSTKLPTNWAFRRTVCMTFAPVRLASRRGVLYIHGKTMSEAGWEKLA